MENLKITKIITFDLNKINFSKIEDKYENIKIWSLLNPKTIFIKCLKLFNASSISNIGFDSIIFILK